MISQSLANQAINPFVGGPIINPLGGAWLQQSSLSGGINPQGNGGINPHLQGAYNTNPHFTGTINPQSSGVAYGGDGNGVGVQHPVVCIPMKTWHIPDTAHHGGPGDRGINPDGTGDMTVNRPSIILLPRSSSPPPPPLPPNWGAPPQDLLPPPKELARRHRIGTPPPLPRRPPHNPGSHTAWW